MLPGYIAAGSNLERVSGERLPVNPARMLLGLTTAWNGKSSAVACAPQKGQFFA